MFNRLPERDPIVTGDLNADVSRFQNPRNKQVSKFLASFGLVDLLRNFRQQLQFLRRQIWFQVRQGKLLRLHFNYILGMDLCLFNIMLIWDLWNFFSYHFPPYLPAQSDNPVSWPIPPGVSKITPTATNDGNTPAG